MLPAGGPILIGKQGEDWRFRRHPVEREEFGHLAGHLGKDALRGLWRGELEKTADQGTIFRFRALLNTRPAQNPQEIGCRIKQRLRTEKGYFKPLWLISRRL